MMFRDRYKRTIVPLTRRERSSIRILHAYGLSKGQISRQVGRSTRSVSRVLDRETGKTDLGDDWDEVTEEFMKRYPPIAINNNIDVRPDTLNFSAKVSNLGSTSIPANLLSQILERPAAQQPKIPNPTDGSPVEVIYISDDESDDEIKEAPPTTSDIASYLKSLEHDLSGLLKELEAQDIGTSAKLFAFAQWPEDRLHALFKATLPSITVPQRFILVHGLKTYSGT
ncbi:hypothetical protein DXG01_006189 [Tephrocybe rancida]|nr:hypothetical protein DXG01_006189 [Tephrocybe rancida]